MTFNTQFHRDKTLNSMQNMLKISREYTHNYNYKGTTTYKDSFTNLDVLALFQKLENCNQTLYQLQVKNKEFELQIVNEGLKKNKNLDSRCMSTINRLKDELIKFLDKKTLFVEQLNKTKNPNSLKMGFKYQEKASQYLTETRISMDKFEQEAEALDNLVSFINFKSPNDLYKYDLELESLYKKLESSTETLLKFNEKFNK